ncbi:YkvI family membrane protein [Zestomonas carbonaria]|uniref:Membrane protein YkvI n=1 Tax=Zestomonas carbonaria TaxID=2762745 RepID=A0A7U7ELX9_9GAMM|nr:hypothetical protein [Pseudomonas carbonaria]CAD5107463.1 hypothetical protein PSEWESI4_01736 [Pseudomonas carbonaria]
MNLPNRAVASAVDKPLRRVNPLTIIKVAGALVAFIIGAGFATGQEVMQFFAVHGLHGIGGSLIFFLLCTYLAVSLLLAGHKHGFMNLDEVFKYYTGNILGVVFSSYAVVMTFSVYVLMLSGAGSVLNESYGYPVYVGSLLLAAIVLLTVYFGLHGLINIIGYIGPLLVVLILVITASKVIQDPGLVEVGNALIPSLEMLQVSSYWWLSGVLYTAIQVVGLFSFLPAIGATVDNRKDLVYAGVLGPALIFCALALTILALISSMPDVNGKLIPMLYMASGTLPFISSLFVVIIFAGVFTTAAPLLWVVLTRFTKNGSTGYRLLAVTLSLFGFAGSLTLPFDRLVNIIYPTIGYSAALLIGFMLIKQIRIRALA